MIERIYSKNYRAFENIDLNLSKINLFFGPNNSGKSSILSVINVLSQTLNSGDRTVPLLLRGVNEDLGTYRDMVYDHDIEKEVTLGIQIKPSQENIPKFFGMKSISGNIELTFGYRSRRHEIVLNKIKISYPEKGFEFELEKSKTYGSILYHTNYLKMGKKINKERTRVAYIDHFLPYHFSYDFSDKNNISYELMDFTRIIGNELKNIEFIGPFREPPKRTYMFSGENPRNVGAQGERAIDVMLMDYYKQGKGKKQIVNSVSKWFKKSEISEKINIVSISDRHLEITLSQIRQKTTNPVKKDENIADVGYGCSQILPILIAGYSLKKDSILMVQEPEIHLHPKAQAELGTFFYELSKKGVQSIIETHSEHLLLRLQAYVADKRSGLSPDDIRIFYVYSDRGKKKCTPLELNPDGRFKTEWPRGFFPERFEEIKKIVKGTVY